MNNQEFAEKLESIANGLDKVAAELDNSHTKQASEESKQNFDMGVVGDKPGNGGDPLLNFIMS